MEVLFEVPITHLGLLLRITADWGSPGPSDYQIKREITVGPKYHFARKYSNLNKESVVPGPSDYAFDQSKVLKKEPRPTIGNAIKDASFLRNQRSPGPTDYTPNKSNFKRRTKSVIFNREKRQGIITAERETSPGPGSYMIPCRFFDKPRFMMKKENRFRFV